MPRRVKTPDGVVHLFPDDATDQEISEALNAPPTQARTTPEGQQRSWMDTAVDLLPMAGGTVGGILGAASGIPTLGLGSVPGAIAGAGVLGAGGEAAKQLINRLRGEEAPETMGEAATDIATQGAIQGGAEAVGGAVTKGVKAGARAVYRGYLKPSLAAKNIPKARQVVETAIDEAIPITRGGTAKAAQVMTDLRREVDDILTRTSGTVDLQKIAERVRGFARRKYYTPGADLGDYKAVLAVADRIDRHPSIGLPPGARPTRIDVSLPQANVVKRSLQESASPSYGVPNATATKQAEKVGGNAARRAIERQAPDVGPLNARESKLIDAARSIAQAVEREANQSKLYGVKTLLAGGVGANEYRRGEDLPTSIAKGVATRALLTPGAQSNIALLANKIAQGLGVSTSLATRLAAHVLSEEPVEDRQE